MKKRYIILIILSLVTVGLLLYYKEGTLAVNSHDKSVKVFVIRRGEGISEIIRDLYKDGLIRDRIVFFIIIKRLGIENQIQAGSFRLSPSMTTEEIALTLTKGTTDEWVTIIEGLRKEEIAQVISEKFDVPASEFIKDSEEGHLFPDTYLIPKDASLNQILSIFSRNFNQKYDEELQQKARQKGLTDQEVITLASLVEKEARHDPDRVQVASIILKRYKNGWPLDIDATVQYALGYQPAKKTWWKKNLTKSDLAIQSPYNTYKNQGLPPGPICNPGLASINAVVNANPNIPYWFYISSRDGSTMHYARTVEEHNENIAKYLR